MVQQLTGTVENGQQNELLEKWTAYLIEDIDRALEKFKPQLSSAAYQGAELFAFHLKRMYQKENL